MKPSIGRIVVIRTAEAHNGSREHPAMVTRVWGDTDPASARGAQVCVNVTVFPDCGVPFCKSSVPLYQTREEAEEGGFSEPCWWPERVS